MYSCQEHAATLSSSQLLAQLFTCLYVYNILVANELLGIHELCRQLVIQICAVGYQYNSRTCHVATTHQHTSKEQHREALSTTCSSKICAALSIAMQVDMRMLQDVFVKPVCGEELRIATNYLPFTLRGVREKYEVLHHTQQSILTEQTFHHGVQGVDTIICLIRTLHFAPGIEKLVRREQRTIFIVHAIADDHESIISEQLWNIPTIAHCQLRVGIHNGSVFLHGTLELQHHYGQTVHIDDAVGNASLQSLYLQLVDNLEDIPVNILKVYHFNEQIRQRGILTLDGETLRHQAIRLCILLIKRSTIVCRQLCYDSLNLQGRDSLLGISVY